MSPTQPALGLNVLFLFQRQGVMSVVETSRSIRGASVGSSPNHKPPNVPAKGKPTAATILAQTHRLPNHGLAFALWFAWGASMRPRPEGGNASRASTRRHAQECSARTTRSGRSCALTRSKAANNQPMPSLTPGLPAFRLSLWVPGKAKRALNENDEQAPLQARRSISAGGTKPRGLWRYSICMAGYKRRLEGATCQRSFGDGVVSPAQRRT